MILWSIEDVEGEDGISLAHDARMPWCRLSPRYQHGQIPVPGIKGMYADSVHGLWEAMKLIGPKGQRGTMNPGYFAGPGRDRPILDTEWCSGLLYRGQQLGLAEAQVKVWLPAYLWTIQNHCPDLLGNLKVAAQHKTVLLYDNIWNVDLSDVSTPVSHAAVVVAFLNNAMDDFQTGTFPCHLMRSIIQ